MLVCWHVVVVSPVKYLEPHEVVHFMSHLVPIFDTFQKGQQDVEEADVQPQQSPCSDRIELQGQA